uniref:Uncharacterized protein n=1 Tax=Panagrolaimus sp. ES5 TaxID=591445 RepID=A0AC34FSN3_9BILA
MTFFGIKNNSTSDDPKFIIRQESFTNVLKKNQINQVVILKEINPLPNYAFYITKPLLYNHFDVLHGILFNENIEDGSLITNRHPIKILSLNQPCSLKIYTIFKELNGQRKKLHVLEAGGPCQNWSIKNYRLGIGLEATLAEEISTYATYGYNKFTIQKDSGSLMNIHYTYQVDAFDDIGNPAEIKALKYPKHCNGIDLPHDFSFRTAVQCKLGRVKKIIVGFNEYPVKNKLLIKEYKISEICVGKVKTDVDVALAKMKLNLVKLMDVYEKQCDEKAIKIEKVPLSEKQDRFIIEFL